MNIKTILYIIIVPLMVWILESMQLERLFKKGRQKQIILFYVVVSLGLSYLIVNFLYDFYEVSKILS
jgi:uncharacterized membrane protein YwzB